MTFLFNRDSTVRMSLDEREGEIRRSLGLTRRAILQDDPRKLVTLVEDPDKKAFVLKVILHDDRSAAASMVREAFWLRQTLFRQPIRTPRLVTTGRDHLLQEFDPGRRYWAWEEPSPAFRNLLSNCLAQLLDLRIRPPSWNVSQKGESASQVAFRTLVRMVMQVFPRVINRRQLLKLIYVYAKGRRALAGKRCTGHGDFTLTNILLDDDERAFTLIDLENFTTSLSPFQDVCHLCCHHAISLRHWTWQRSILRDQIMRVTRRWRRTFDRKVVERSLRLHLALEIALRLDEQTRYEEVLPSRKNTGALARILGGLRVMASMRGRSLLESYRRAHSRLPGGKTEVRLRDLEMILSDEDFGAWASELLDASDEEARNSPLEVKESLRQGLSIS
jgi:hypothetical protein